MLDNINSINARMSQIEARLNAGPSIDSAAFNQFMGNAQQVQQQPEAAPNKLTAEQMLAMKSPTGMSFQPGLARAGTLDVNPLAQSNSISCGQTSVAMSINALTGKNLKDTDINNKYGFNLLGALNSESGSAGYAWKDAGNIQPSSWDLIDYKVNSEKTPVIVALNGPEFSPSGHGHIVTITKTEGDVVTFADPATGKIRTTTKQAMNNAPKHPDGNFIFYALKDDASGTPNTVASR